MVLRRFIFRIIFKINAINSITDLMDVHMTIDEGAKGVGDRIESAANDILQAAAAFNRLRDFE
jgi:hypothetical protein